MEIEDINERELWKYPSRAWKLVLLGMFPMYAIVLFTDTTPESAGLPQTLVLFASFGVFFAGIIYALISYKTFWTEPKLLEEANADWQPSRAVYIGCSLILTPILMSGIYSFNRHRKLSGKRTAESEEEDQPSAEEDAPDKEDSTPLVGAHPDMIEGDTSE